MSASPPGCLTDERVVDYIDPLPDWQQAICRELRDLIRAADPEVTETIKRTVQPYPASSRDRLCASCGSRTETGCALLSAVGRLTAISFTLSSAASADRLKQAPAGALPPNKAFARPISVIITNTSSAATTPAATRLWLISTSNDFFSWSSRSSR